MAEFIQFNHEDLIEDRDGQGGSESKETITESKGLNEHQKAIQAFFESVSITVGGEGGDNPEVITFTPAEAAKIAESLEMRKHSSGTPVDMNIRFLENIKNLGLRPEEWKSVIIKQPSFCYQKPETLNANVEQSAKMLGLTKDQFVHAATKQPPLFGQKPETLNANVEQSAEMFGLTKDQFVHAATKQPSLFYRKPETLNANVEQSAQLLGLTKDQFVHAATKSPQLFYQKPETLNANVEQSAQLLGLTKDQFVHAATKPPSLFYQKPETLNANVEQSAEMLGLTKDQFVHAATRQPSLFCQRPETIKGNFEMIVLLFDGQKEKAQEFVLNNPAALTLSQERTAIHDLARHITGSRLTITRNPESALRGYFEASGNPSGGEKLLRALDYYKKIFSEARKIEAKEKNKNKK